MFFIFGIVTIKATSVVPVSLEQMSVAAGRIFIGTCTEAVTQTRDGLTFTEYQFTISRTLKGEQVPHVAVRHFGTLKKANSLLKGIVPKYEIGGEYLLFLTPSSRIGFCAPVGLGQGAFRIVRAADGTARALNGTHNAGLFPPARPLDKALGRALTPTEHRIVAAASGPLPLDELTRITSTLVARAAARKSS